MRLTDQNERVKIVKDHSEHGFYELVIPDVKHIDAGIYKCIAKNSFGESISQSNVTVTGKVVCSKILQEASSKTDFRFQKHL